MTETPQAADKLLAAERAGNTAVPPGFVRVRRDGCTAVLREDLAAVPMASLWAQGTELAGAAGRSAAADAGGVSTFELVGDAGPVAVVARDYRRGGVLGAILGGHYFGGSRAERELFVTETLRVRGLSVVEPVAVVRRRSWWTYRLRLLTQRVDGAVPLPAFVRQHPLLRRSTVTAAGQLVAEAFAAGLLHRDLHVENLIASTPDELKSVRVLLLDLDRAELRTPLDQADRDAMLLRMARHRTKHHQRIADSKTDTLRFLAGFGWSRAERRREILRLAPAFERMLARHRTHRVAGVPSTP